jgi:hypothetical protein
MPFTVSHSAIVLPFLKNKRLSATALIVGSMSPDFEYFFRMHKQSEFSHTFLGIFVVDFPLSFLVMFVFHQIIKKPMIENLPIYFQQRMQELKELNWIIYFKNNIFIVLTSLFLGAVSHLFWDSFTHLDGYFVERIPFLRLEIYSIHFSDIAQYLTSLIGLVFISIYFRNMPVKKINSKPINMNYWYLSGILSLVIISFRFSYMIQMHDIGKTVVNIISPIIIAVTLAGFVFRNKNII